MNTIFQVTELEPTIEGEGLWVGLPVVILRLFGCNLRCPWCDSERSYSDISTAKPYTLEQLIKKIEATKIKRVAITGGEPFLTPDLPHLTKTLDSLGYIMKIETNGTKFLEEFEKSKNINIVCSPKPNDYKTDTRLLSLADELKFVVDDTLTLDILLEERFKDLYKNIPLILQPESNKPEMIKKAIGFGQDLLEIGLEARVIPQVHKFMNIP